MQKATVTVLYARADSIYHQLNGCDVWTESRNATLWPGGTPVIAHPPCRAWGRLRKLANPKPHEKALAVIAIDQVRRNGGVLEHPAWSTLWTTIGLPPPVPSATDLHGGWTLPIDQYWFGHRARKPTWLYIVGVTRSDVPPIPLALGDASHVIGAQGRRTDGSRLRKGDPRWRPEVTRSEREATPKLLAEWLIELARRTTTATATAALRDREV